MKRKQIITIITGISGMDGSTLADKLLAKKHKVIGVDRWLPTGTSINLKNIIDNPNFIMETGDITEKKFMEDLIIKWKPDYLYNLAAISLVPESFKIPETVFITNTIAVLNMLETIRYHSRKTKFYQASTSEQIGDTTKAPQDTESKMLPNSPYAISKLAAYHLVRQYRNAFGLFCVNGMLWNHEGPRRGPDFVTRKISIGVANILHGNQNFIELGNLDAKRDWGLSSDFCVPGNTKILVKSNKKSYHNTVNKQIKDLSIDDFVLTYNIKNGKKEFKKITNTQNRIVNELYELKLSNNNKLNITGNHPIAVIDKGNIIWKNVKDLSIGDKMIQKNHFSVTRRIKNFIENKTRMTDKIKNKIAQSHKGKILTQKIKNKIKKAINKRYESKEECMKSSQPGKNFLFNPDIEIVTIIEINKNNKKTKVYNIETLDNHNYFAHGLLVHNCDAMILAMDAKKADDWAVNTGESHTIREFVNEAFKIVGTNITWKGHGMKEKGYDNNGELKVKINKKFFRPVEVNYLHGNYNKIKKELGWKPKTKFKNLVKLMVEYDVKRLGE